MKKILFYLAFVFLINNAFGQWHIHDHQGRSRIMKWLSISAKGGYGTYLLTNKAVKSDTNITRTNWNEAYTFGTRIGVTKGNHWGLFAEYAYHRARQDYNFNLGGDDLYIDKTLEFTSHSLTVLGMYKTLGGFYVQLGPQFIKFWDVMETNVGTYSKVVSQLPLKYDKRSRYEEVDPSYLNFILETGHSILRLYPITVNLGVRFTYSHKDLMQKDSYFTLDGAYNQYMQKVDLKSEGTPYLPYKATKPFSAMIMFEIDYFFGFWGDPNCGKGKLLLFK